MTRLVALILLAALSHLVSAVPLFMAPDPLQASSWSFSLESGDSTSNELTFVGSGGVLQDNTIGFSFDGGATFSRPIRVLDTDFNYSLVSATATSSGTQLGSFTQRHLLQFDISLRTMPGSVRFSLNGGLVDATLLSTPVTVPAPATLALLGVRLVGLAATLASSVTASKPDELLARVCCLESSRPKNGLCSAGNSCQRS